MGALGESVLADWYAFVLAALALLATPGPTNTLLATSGAAAGFNRSLKLILAEMLGYMVSITVLSLVIGPIVRASHDLSVALRIGCALFLVYAAWRLWREGAAEITSGKPVPFHRLLVATLLNPKGIVFAFVIVPFMAQGNVQAGLPYMAVLLALIGAVGSAWIGVGAAIKAGAHFNGGIVRRAGAVVLCVFAAVISSSVLAT